MTIGNAPPYDNIQTPTPTVDQQSKTAANLVLNLSLGITQKDTFQPFTEMNKAGLWKEYETNMARPTLPQISQSKLSGSDEKAGEWGAQLANIMQTLPPDVQEKLTELKKLSPDEQNSFPNFKEWKALEAVLNFAAQTEYFMKTTTESSETEASRAESLINSELPSIVSKNMAEQAAQLAEDLKADLKKRLNDPEYDACSYLISQYESLVDKMAKITEKT